MVAEPAISISLSERSIPAEGDCGVTVRVDCAEVPLYVALIVADWFELTVVVETVKVAEVEAAGTVTVAGTVAADVLEESDTVAPPAGAELESETVPCTEPPPVTDVAERLRVRT